MDHHSYYHPWLNNVNLKKIVMTIKTEMCNVTWFTLSTIFADIKMMLEDVEATFAKLSQYSPVLEN